MIDILFDNLDLTSFLLINISVQIKGNITLTSQLTWIKPWRLNPEIILYDTDNNQRFKVEIPLLFRRQRKEGVFETADISLKVIETYLL